MSNLNKGKISSWSIAQYELNKLVPPHQLLINKTKIWIRTGTSDTQLVTGQQDSQQGSGINICNICCHVASIHGRSGNMVKSQ